MAYKPRHSEAPIRCGGGSGRTKPTPSASLLGDCVRTLASYPNILVGFYYGVTSPVFAKETGHGPSGQRLLYALLEVAGNAIVQVTADVLCGAARQDP